MRALLMGPAVHPFRAGLEKMVTTHWDFVEVGFAMDDADVVRGLADADAAIGISFTKAAPPAPRLRLLQVPGAGYADVAVTAPELAAAGASPVHTPCTAPPKPHQWIPP